MPNSTSSSWHSNSDPSAKQQLERWLADKPNDPVVLSRLAAVQAAEGHLDEAKIRLEKVVAQNPQFVPATRQLALLYGISSGQDSKAYDIVRKARQAYPGDAEIAKILGVLNYRRGLAPQSLELLKEAAAKRKDDPELLYTTSLRTIVRPRITTRARTPCNARCHSISHRSLRVWPTRHSRSAAGLPRSNKEAWTD